MSHTPTPWKPTYSKHFQTWRIEHEGGNLTVCDFTDFGHMPAEENARFVCNAVNCHEELLAALSGVLSAMDKSDQWWIDEPSRGGFDREAIEAAISKAREPLST